MWVVSSREGTRVQVNVSSMETQKFYDYVEVIFINFNKYTYPLRSIIQQIFTEIKWAGS